MPSRDTSPPRRGRPPKFGRPARAVTVTLPEDVLAMLRRVDADLGAAVVKIVERRRPLKARLPKAADISSFGSHSVIVVAGVRALRRLPGVQLVPFGPGRYLIALVPPRSIPQLELDLRDLLEREGMDRDERETVEGVADILRNARASRDVVPEQRTIIVLESRRRRVS